MRRRTLHPVTHDKTPLRTSSLLAASLGSFSRQTRRCFMKQREEAAAAGPPGRREGAQAPPGAPREPQDGPRPGTRGARRGELAGRRGRRGVGVSSRRGPPFPLPGGAPLPARLPPSPQGGLASAVTAAGWRCGHGRKRAHTRDACSWRVPEGPRGGVRRLSRGDRAAVVAVQSLVVPEAGSSTL